MSLPKDSVWAKTMDYMPVRHDVPEEIDGANFERKPFQKNWLCIPTTWKVILATALVISAISVSLFAIRTPENEPFHTHKNICGNSTSEALSLGCSFDHLTWAWYPPHCSHYTNELFRTAEAGNPFHYYEKLESTEPINEDDFFSVVESQHRVWAQKGEHLTHCVYLLLAQAQIRRDGTNPVPILVQYEHMEHCTNFLLESIRKDDEFYHKNALTPVVDYDQRC